MMTAEHSNASIAPFEECKTREQCNMPYYYNDLNTFEIFLQELGYEITNKEAVNHGTKFTLSNNVKVTLYNNSKIQVQGVEPQKNKVEKKINDTLNEDVNPPINQSTQSKKEVFIVHGRDTQTREQLELILHKLGISDQYILQNASGNGLTIIEALENKIGQQQKCTRFGIVLLTPDDYGYAKNEDETKKQHRARQNVILEMGMLLSSLGRKNVAILKKQNLELPSDASGILYYEFNDHVKEIVPRLVEHLSKSGFKIEAEKIANASN